MAYADLPVVNPNEYATSTWANTVRDDFLSFKAHTHTGSPDGALIGPSGITNRTRSFSIVHGIARVGSPAQSTYVVTSAAWAGWAFDPSTQESVTFGFQVPQDYASGGQIWLHMFLNAGVNYGTAWSGTFDYAANAVALNTNVQTSGTVAYAFGSTLNVMKVQKLFDVNAVAGARATVDVSRVVADAGDTHSADAVLALLEFRYTSDS